MNNSEEIIKQIKESLVVDGDKIKTQINGMDVSFKTDSLEYVWDRNIDFAIDLVNEYKANKGEYENIALEMVKKFLTKEANDSEIIEQLGIPSIEIDVSDNEFPDEEEEDYYFDGAFLYYGKVKEIDDHYPILNVQREDGEYECGAELDS